jgi:hypothetical protein
VSSTQRVTGIGGVFFKTRDRARLGDWYRRHLGIDVQDGGWALFRWRDHEDPAREGVSVDERVEETAEGRFGWITDPDGNRIELWQPPAGR